MLLAKPPTALMPPALAACELPRRALGAPLPPYPRLSTHCERPPVCTRPQATIVALRARSACPQTLTQCTPLTGWRLVLRVASRGLHCHRCLLSTTEHCGPRPTRARFCSAEQAGLVCARGCVKAGEGGRLRGRIGWSRNLNMRDYQCSSTEGRLCAVRARSARRAHRRFERGRIRGKKVRGTTHRERRRSSSHDRRCDDGNRASRLPRCRARRPTPEFTGTQTASAAPLFGCPVQRRVRRHPGLRATAETQACANRPPVLRAHSRKVRADAISPAPSS